MEHRFHDSYRLIERQMCCNQLSSLPKVVSLKLHNCYIYGVYITKGCIQMCNKKYGVMQRTIVLITFIIGCNVTFAQFALYKNEFPLGEVTLLDGPFKHARDLNIDVILQYDVDRLLAPYQKEAGLTPKALSFPNWDGLDGHVGGHYLSALAMNYAATANTVCKQRMEYMLSMLKACQLRSRYSLSFWDSQLISCALLAGCTIFESEDMDDGLLVEGALRISNPFKP